MPIINGQYVDFDPEKLSDAIVAGHSVAPDRYDYEDQNQFQQRTQKEYEQISEILKRKDPKAWKRWHGIPDPENMAPLNEWKKLPTMRNFDTLASLGTGETPLTILNDDKQYDNITNRIREARVKAG